MEKSKEILCVGHKCCEEERRYEERRIERRIERRCLGHRCHEEEGIKE